MIEITNIFIKDGKPDELDPKLEVIMEQTLGMPVSNFIIKVKDNVENIIGYMPKWEFLICKFWYTKRKSQGYAIKRHKGLSNEAKRICPDMMFGWTGDVEDFEKTVIHEILHISRWDERAVQRKTLHIYDKVHGIKSCLK